MSGTERGEVRSPVRAFSDAGERLFLPEHQERIDGLMAALTRARAEVQAHRALLSRMATGKWHPGVGGSWVDISDPRHLEPMDKLQHALWLCALEDAAQLAISPPEPQP